MNDYYNPSFQNKLELFDYIKELAKDMATSLSPKKSIIKNSKNENVGMMKRNFQLVTYENNLPFYEKKLKERHNFNNKMDNLRKKKQGKEEMKFTFSPNITSNSRNLSGKNDPIHKRIDKIMMEKEITRDLLKRTYMQKDLIKESNIKYNSKKFEKWVTNQVSKKKEQLRMITENKEKVERQMLKSMHKPKINKTFHVSYKPNKSATESLTKRSVDRESVHEKLYKNTEENNRVVTKKCKLIEQHTPSFNPIINKKIPNFKNTSFNISNVTSKTISKVHSKIITDITPNNMSVMHTQRSVNNSIKGEKFIKTTSNDENDLTIGLYRISLNHHQNKFEEFNKNKMKIIKQKREKQNKKIKIVSQRACFSNLSKNFLNNTNDFTMERLNKPVFGKDNDTSKAYSIRNNLPGQELRVKFQDSLVDEENSNYIVEKSDNVSKLKKIIYHTQNINKKNQPTSVNIKKFVNFKTDLNEEKNEKTKNSLISNHHYNSGDNSPHFRSKNVK